MDVCLKSERFEFYIHFGCLSKNLKGLSFTSILFLLFMSRSPGVGARVHGGSQFFVIFHLTHL